MCSFDDVAQGVTSAHHLVATVDIMKRVGDLLRPRDICPRKPHADYATTHSECLDSRTFEVVVGVHHHPMNLF